MFKTSLKYGAGLIALYLVVEYWTGFTKGVTASGTAGSNVIKAFQGR